MNIVAKIEDSIGRDGNGEPINEVLFSVNQHEENNNNCNYSLWIGLPKSKGDGKYDFNHVTCLDVCVGVFWEKVMERDIKRYLAYTKKHNDETLESWKEELKLVQEGLEESIYVKKKLTEVL